MGEFFSEVAGAPCTNKTNDSGSVKREPPTGISVLIAGAGVGGLTAALECYRKGHSVRVFERGPYMSTAGDMFTIGYHGRRWILNHWPEMTKELEEIGMVDGYQTILRHTGEELQSPVPFMKALSHGRNVSTYSELAQCHHLRPLFHGMLYRQIQKLGIEVVYNKRVVDYFEDEARGLGGVVTSDGLTATADVVIAADGGGSKSQMAVNKGVEEARPSGKSVYRAAFPTHLAFADPLVKEHYGLIDDKHPVFRVHVGFNINTMVLTRPDITAFSFTYTTNEDIRESWHNVVSKDKVLATLEEYPGLSEALKALVRTAPPDRIVNWPLVWRNPQPQWTSPGGRIVQIGDAAHSLLPSSGNGAAQAMEDGVTIATCLALGGKSNIPLALRTHNKLRFERVSYIQKLGFANAEILSKGNIALGSPAPPQQPGLQPQSPASPNPMFQPSQTTQQNPADARPSSASSSTATTPGASPAETPGTSLSATPDVSPLPSPGQSPSTSPNLTPRNVQKPPLSPATISATAAAAKGVPALRSSSGRPMTPKWVLWHDAEKYALENYTACATSILQGTDFVNTNVPPGSTFKPWTLQEILDDSKMGKPVQLSGDWS